MGSAVHSSSFWWLFSPANRIWYQSCGNPRPRKRPQGWTPPRHHRSLIPMLRSSVHLDNHPAIADIAASLEVKLFTGQHNSGLFCCLVFLTHPSLPPHQESLPSCLCACEHVHVFAWLEANLRSTSSTKTALGLQDGKASLSDVEQIFQIQPSDRCFSTASPSEQLRPPARRSIATLEGAESVPYIRCRIILTPSVWVFVCRLSHNDGDLNSQHSPLLHLMSLRNFSFFLLLVVSVSIARTSKFSHLLRLADNFWWWVTIRAKRLYLGLVSASVSMWLLLLLISFCCLHLHYSISSGSAKTGPFTGWETSAVGFIPGVPESTSSNYDEVTPATALRDWTNHSITKHEKHLTMITSSKQIVPSLASLSFLVAFFFFLVILKNFNSNASIPTVGLHLRTQWMRFPFQTDK